MIPLESEVDRNLCLITLIKFNLGQEEEKKESIKELDDFILNFHGNYGELHSKVKDNFTIKQTNPSSKKTERILFETAEISSKNLFLDILSIRRVHLIIEGENDL